MKRIVILGIIISAILSVSAQTQEGYVRTLERPDKGSEFLEGVTILVRGGHNAVVSSADGHFRLNMAGKQVGDSYFLQQIHKKGYELADQGVIGRCYAYSESVPLMVVMVSTAQLQVDKQRIENAAYQTAERNYHTQLDALERQLSDSSISEETYRMKLQQLQENLERYQGLIESLADHYARTDYALLDEKEREVNLCIERGDLEKADSLLATMFNPLGVLERNREALTDANRRLSEGQGVMEQAQKDLAAVLRQQEKDAEYLYQLYTIALARFDNDKARQYIETRAALDTTNILWQLEVARYIETYTSDYTNALNYYKQCLRQASVQTGRDTNELTAPLYKCIGQLYHYMGFDTMALQYFSDALFISIGLDSAFIATLYNNIAASYQNINNIEEARKYQEKALGIRLAVLPPNDYHIATSYNNLGTMEDNPVKSLDCHQKALQILLSSVGENHPNVALCYFNIASSYARLGNHGKACDYLEKAVSLQQKLTGENHPNMIAYYNFIGHELSSVFGEHQGALQSYSKSLRIAQAILREDHSKLGDIYYKLGCECYELEHFIESVEYLENALYLFRKYQGENSTRVKDCGRKLALSYYGAGSNYLSVDKLDIVLDYLHKALALQEQYLADDAPEIQMIRGQIKDIIEIKKGMGNE